MPHDLTFGTEAAARIIGTSERAVRRLIASRTLRAVRKRPDGPRWSLKSYRIRHADLAAYLTAAGNRPGLERLRTWATTRTLTTPELCRMLDKHRWYFYDHIKAGRLAAFWDGGRWKYTVAAVGEFLRAHGSPEAQAYAARLLRPATAALVVASRDRLVRRATCEWEPVICSSMFALGWAAARTPVWGVVIDWTLDGSRAATDAAERLSATDDRPVTVGITAEDGYVARGSGIWDVVLTRPITAANLAACVRELYATAGPRP
jgi:hypothetical protein